MPAKNGSVCLQELKQTDIGRALRARARIHAGGRMGARVGQQQRRPGAAANRAARMAQGGRSWRG